LAWKLLNGLPPYFGELYGKAIIHTIQLPISNFKTEVLRIEKLSKLTQVSLGFIPLFVI
jgi:hypothetical protein